MEALIVGVLVPITGAFVWLVKAVTNDMRHDLQEVKEHAVKQTKILQRIEKKL